MTCLEKHYGNFEFVLPNDFNHFMMGLPLITVLGGGGGLMNEEGEEEED